MIYILGDIHLKDYSDPQPGTLGGEGWGKNHQALIQFIESLPLTKEDIVIQLGDLFDKTSCKGATNRAALTAIKHLSNKCKEVILLQGNHDISKYSGSNLDSVNIFENVTSVTNICHDTKYNILFLPYIDGLHVSGAYEEEVNAYLKKFCIKDVDYIFGHHFFKENTVMSNPHLDLDKINVKYKICIQGHVHKYEYFSDKKICIGSLSPINKGEEGYSFKYGVIEEDKFTAHNIIPVFNHFKFLSWPFKEEIATKDFYVIKCNCKREEKYLIEQEIRAKINKSQLYEIEWEIEEEIKEEKIEIKSEDELVTKFFEENTYSKEVKDTFWNYYRKM